MRRKSLNNVSYLLLYVESYVGISFYINFIYLTNADNFERKSGEKSQSKIDLKELKNETNLRLRHLIYSGEAGAPAPHCVWLMHLWIETSKKPHRWVFNSDTAQLMMKFTSWGLGQMANGEGTVIIDF